MEKSDGAPQGDPAVSYDAEKIQRTAQKSYQGPVWIRWATAATLLFSVGTVTFGIIRPKSVPKVKPSNPVVTAKKTPPQSAVSVSGLPLSIGAEFVLPATGGVDSHLAVANSDIYFGKLVQPVNQWPAIHLSKAPFSDSGKSLQESLVQGETIELIPPIPTGLQQSAKAPTYSVSHWNMFVMNDWVVASVQWTSKQSPSTKYQLYGLYLPTSRSAMFRTLDAPNSSVSFQIAAGDGKVLIAKVATTPTTNRTSAKGAKSQGPSYPVEIDSLGGNNPLQAVTKSQELTVGVPVLDPVVSNQLILFHTFPSTKFPKASLKWYALSTSGGVQPLQGLPPDVTSTVSAVGKEGDAYVISTALWKSEPGQFTVRLNSLTQGSGRARLAPLTLPGPASYVAVSDGSLVWIQDSNGARVMVVARVN